MQLHTVTVFYRRQAQPAQYEAEEVRLEGSATVEDGEDFEAVAYDLVTRARVQAHRALGLKVPAIAEFSPAFEESSYAVRAAEGGLDAAAEEKPKRTRRTKAEMEAARAAEAHPTPAAVPADDIVIGEEPKAAEPELDITEEPKEIDDKTLQSEAAGTAKKLGAEGTTKVKALMREFGAMRLGDIAKGRRAVFLSQLKALA